MFIGSETTSIFLLLLIALGILAWSYNRSRSYGQLGLLAWLQTVALMTPWLLFFILFSLGIYINFMGILLLLIVSVVAYIMLGNRLRALGQDEMIRQKAALRLKQEAETSSAKNQELTQNNKREDNQEAIEIIPIPEEDLKTIKGIFGIDTFFATETISYQEGAIFRGNMRGEPEEVHQRLSKKLTEVLGDKYRLFLVDSPEGKPVVIILPSSNDPQTTTLAQKNIALVLLVGTIATSLESTGLLLGFDWFSNLGRYGEAIPISLGLWGVLAAHELGHYFIAKGYNIRMSIPFLIPNWQIGSFGAITRFESLLPNRQALFDIALAGPAVGGIVSVLMLIAGLSLSHPGSVFQIPLEFFQGSILVGGLARLFLGAEFSYPLIDVHPLVVMGWLGLVINALNLLPAGQLDGGRIIQAIYGRKIARRTTIATLIILGIVTLVNPSNPIPLYWSILILFLQRDLERPTLNELIEVDDNRAALGLLALLLMLATLIPLRTITNFL